jgi:uncharacterized protein (TIGR03083 family)
MSKWNAMTYEGKDTILGVVRNEAAQFYAMVDNDDVWEAPTGAGHWQVRDVVGHLVDTTEAYFVGFDAARSKTELGGAYGLPAMHQRVDEMAQGLSRTVPQAELVERARGDQAKMMGMFEALSPDDWSGLVVEHVYMGPLPAFFYPTFQLIDYGVHSWDIRQGTGRAHGLNGDTADLLVPFMLIVWQATADVTAEAQPSAIGIRVTSGHNAGTWRIIAGPSGVTYETGPVDDLPSVIEFDPGSFVLTAYGRSNAGTIRGDVAVADRFLNSFFRI